jgi:hypothetical protein
MGDIQNYIPTENQNRPWYGNSNIIDSLYKIMTDGSGNSSLVADGTGLATYAAGIILTLQNKLLGEVYNTSITMASNTNEQVLIPAIPDRRFRILSICQNNTDPANSCFVTYKNGPGGISLHKRRAGGTATTTASTYDIIDGRIITTANTSFIVQNSFAVTSVEIIVRYLITE